MTDDGTAADDEEMSPEDEARWQSARTLTDLGELTALFLEGEISQMPSHPGPPNPETDALVSVLAAVNRAGFVTHHSQPGYSLDEDGSAQRASVSGFAGSKTFAALAGVLADTDLVIATPAPSGEESLGPFIAVTLDAGEELTWDGLAEARAELETLYSPVCYPEAVRAVGEAWQVTIIDLGWGRNDVLWPALGRFAAESR